MARRAVPVALALALACAGAPQSSGPVPLAVAPSQGAGVQPLSVEIAGRFDAWVRTDFGDPSGSQLEARFVARLEPVAGGAAVDLADVTLSDRRKLRATVPAGLSPGAYRLTVTDPRGRTGTLEQAFRVVTSAESVASFHVEVLEPPRAGIPFGVSLTALDARGVTVEGFGAAVTVSDLTGGLSASLGPFVLGRFQAQVAIPGLATGDRLVATDALGRSGSSAPFDVVAGPAMAVVFTGPAASVAPGACSPAVGLELRDALGHPATAEADLPIALQSAPPGLGFFSDAGCASPATAVTVSAGASRASFHFQSPAAGPVTVRLVPGALPSASRIEIVSP